MALMSKLWSLSALSVELGINIRTLARRLRDSPPDGKLGQHDAWYLKSVLAALDRPQGSGGSSDAIVAIEQAGADVEDLLDQLRDADRETASWFVAVLARRSARSIVR